MNTQVVISSAPVAELVAIKEEARRIQDKVENLEELIEAYETQQEQTENQLVSIFMEEVEELITYLEDLSREDGKFNAQDRNYCVLKWALEDSLRRLRK